MTHKPKLIVVGQITGAFDVNHLFAAIRTFPKGPDGTLYDHIKAARLFSCNEKQFVFSKTAMYCKCRDRTQRLIA